MRVVFASLSEIIIVTNCTSGVLLLDTSRAKPTEKNTILKNAFDLSSGALSVILPYVFPFENVSFLHVCTIFAHGHIIVHIPLHLSQIVWT